MRLTHVEVAYLLGTTQEEALKKIIMVAETDPNKGDLIMLMGKKRSVESEDFDKRYGTNITFAANDIVNNCLKRAAFKKYLFHDWPKKILDSDRPPKKIQLPVPLRRLVTDNDKDQIKRYWEQNFGDYISPNWSKEHKLIFEP